MLYIFEIIITHHEYSYQDKQTTVLISSPGWASSYIGQTVRHLQTRFREHLGCSGTMRRHIETCDPSVKISEYSISILARANKYIKLLTLEALFINEIKPDLNTKDEYRSRTLPLNFESPVVNFFFIFVLFCFLLSFYL